LLRPRRYNIYIYAYTYMRVCVCVCLRAFACLSVCVLPIYISSDKNVFLWYSTAFITFIMWLCAFQLVYTIDVYVPDIALTKLHVGYDYISVCTVHCLS